MKHLIKTIDTIKNKKILVVSFTASTPHLETSLEITKRLSSMNKVSYVHLGKYVSRPTLYPGKLIKRKLQLPVRVNRAKKYIEQDINQNEDVNWINSKKINSKVHKFDYAIKDLTNKFMVNDIIELKSIKFKNYQIGFGLANNLISDLKDTNPFPLEKENLKEIKQQYYSAIKTVLLAEILLEDNSKYDSVILLNGRFSCENAFKQVANYKRLEIFFHECGAPYPINRFYFENYMPQNFDYRKKEILEIKDKLPNDSIRSIGENFFKRKTSGDGVYEKSYVSNQLKDLSTELRQFINTHKNDKLPIISFFTSNDDEFNIIEGSPERFPIWNNQRAAIEKISKISQDLNCCFIVRVHPNLQAKSIQEKRRWQEISKKININGGYWIGESSPESTYSLIKSSDIIITSGSSVGIEAVFLNKISIALAKCYYNEVIDCMYTATSPEELIQLINNYQDLSKPKGSEAYIYGAWSMEYGTEFKYFQQEKFGYGKMEGNKRIASPGISQKIAIKLKIIYRNL